MMREDDKKKMKVGLQPELRQILAPKLMQFLRLLQLPTLDLQQLLRQELEINPFLEEVEEDEITESQKAEETLINLEPEERELRTDDSKINWEDYLQEGLDGGYPSYSTSQEVYEKVPVSTPSFEDYLFSQLQILPLSGEELRIGEYIIGNLDEKGYLTCPPAEIAEELKVSREEVDKVLWVVQRLDPPGVAATSLEECLLIQLSLMGMEESLAAKIIKECFSDLEKKKYTQLAKRFQVTEEEVREAEGIIATLQPKPGLAYSKEEVKYVIPDFVVEQIDNDFVVILNKRSFPRLRISPIYREILQRTKNLKNSSEREYVFKRLESARFWAKMLTQRESTLKKVMEQIVELQRDFFTKGVLFLHPLTLKTVAERVKVHESTVSRAIHGKYVLTPKGVFGLEYFFSRRVKKEKGGEITRKGIKVRIAELIGQENSQEPLSDQAIVAILEKEGIKVARRTVAKYREELKILPAKFRMA